MSAGSLLNAEGKVPSQYLDTLNLGVVSANSVATEIISLPVGSLDSAVDFADSTRLAAGKVANFQTNIALTSVTNADFVLSSTAVVSAVAAGAATGTWLRVKLNGTYYKIALLADA
jgi:hypothetical protein